MGIDLGVRPFVSERAGVLVDTEDGSGRDGYLEGIREAGFHWSGRQTYLSGPADRVRARRQVDDAVGGTTQRFVGGEQARHVTACEGEG